MYIGETEDLEKRLSGPRKEIPNWTHYSYFKLPSSVNNFHRQQLETMMIRAFAHVLPNETGLHFADDGDLSEGEPLSLVNKKIDRKG